MNKSLCARLALTFSLGSLGFFFSTTADAATCTIAFGQSPGLRAMPPEQAYGFAQAPWYTSFCGGVNFVNSFTVDENGGSLYGHYHIGPDDPAINCFTTTSTWPLGVFGRQVGAGPCVAVDPLTTSRTVGVHSTTHMIRVHANNSNRWRPIQILVRGSAAARVLVEQANGTWWQYTNLAPGTWNLVPTGQFARNAWVHNQISNAAPVSFDNFVVEHQL